MIDVSSFGPKDAKIIRDNPGKSAYEYLNLGITQKAYERLTNGDFKEIPEVEALHPEPPLYQEETPIQPKTMEEKISSIVQPSAVKKVSESKVKLTSPHQYKQQKVSLNSGSKRVLNKRTGKTVTMSATAANRLTKSPHLYTILD